MDAAEANFTFGLQTDSMNSLRTSGCGNSGAPREIVIVFCDDAQQEQEAASLIPLQLEAVQDGEKAARAIQDERRGMTSIIRRVNAPGGRQWTWVSGAVRP